MKQGLVQLSGRMELVPKKRMRQGAVQFGRMEIQRVPKKRMGPKQLSVVGELEAVVAWLQAEEAEER
jgi:hypothetical protein